MKNKIIPAVLVKKQKDLNKELVKFSQIENVDRVQLDICDGVYVENTTWPFDEIAKQDFTILFEKENDLFLEGWENISFTADIMCRNPENYLDTLISYAFDEVVIHFRSINFSTWDSLLQKCRNYEIKIALAIDLKTNISEFINFVKENNQNISYIQVMGIKNIGKQGESFDENILEIIKTLKKDFPEKDVCIDGGMHRESIELCKKAGANIFVVGSDLQVADIKSKIIELETI